DTPNPLSRAQVREVINLAREKAARFIDHSFLDGLKSKTREVFGIGLMHKSNREYINKLLGLKEEHFYRKGDLEEAVGLLTDKGDREIAHALGIKESDVRNRLTSMLLVLGFMGHLGVEQINTIDVTGITGVFFTDKLCHLGN
ncbi:MAG: hypothetical protein K0M45_07045, partial [Candidatus Paracaedibacteraceae bacterium]|nr:hypothetical protein [Candidatus Paracaedibacteraceae bacterium]